MRSKFTGKVLNVSVCGKNIEIKATRSMAIKAKCTDCSVGQPTEVRECPCTDCPLYVFRGYIRWDKDESVQEIPSKATV